MVSNSLVSIIIPVYNVEEYIRECLDSIIKQDYQNYEVLCIVDGSTDSSDTIIESYVDKDKRFKVIFQDNQGAGPARNNGIDNAKGKYVMFMDPDDWYPDIDVISYMVQKIETSNCHIAGGSLQFYDSAKKQIVKDKVPKAIFKEEKIMDFREYQYDYFFQRFIYSKEFLDTHNLRFSDYRRYQDVLFLLNCMSVAKAFYCFEKETYTYRGENHATSFYSDEKTLAWIDGMNKALEISAINGWKQIHYKTVLQFTYDNYLSATFNLRSSFNEIYNKKIECTSKLINWNYLQFYDYDVDSYYVTYVLKYGPFFWDLSHMDPKKLQDYSKLIISKIGIIEYVKTIIYNYIGKKDKILPILNNIKRNELKSKIKTIGIFNESLNVGGVERYISLIIPILQNMGYKIILLTESDPKDDKFTIDSKIQRIVLPGFNQNDRIAWLQRVDVLSRSVLDYKIDLIYYNSYWKENLIFDSLICNQICRIPFIIHHHNVFSAMLARNNDFFYRAWKLYSFADCIVCLSSVDELYFRSRGLPSLYIPNPSNYFIKTDCERDNNKLIWAGRFVPNHKQPIEVLKIIDIVSKKIPDVKLYLLGDGEDSVKDELYNFVSSHSLQNNVFFCGFIKDMISEYSTATLMIMTSRIEGFPMVVSECKSQGLPLVAYDLPYVEMIRDGQGVVTVPQGDVIKAADVICDLLSDKKQLLKMSEDAIASLSNYSDEIIERKWIHVIDLIENNSTASLIPINPNDRDVQILIDTLSYHSQISKQPSINKNIKVNSPTSKNISSKGLFTTFLNGFNSVIRRRQKSIQLSKYEEMLLDHWKPIEDLNQINTDLILSAGIGSKIEYHLANNRKQCQYRLPLEESGDYSLESIIKFLKIGPHSLFDYYEIIGEENGHLIVSDVDNKIISRKQFPINESVDESIKKIILMEENNLTELKSKFDDYCDCTIIMCNRNNYPEVKHFTSELSVMFQKVSFTIINFLNYPELEDKIVYKIDFISDRTNIVRVAMNDNSKEKWKGNADNWKSVLNHIQYKEDH